MIHWLAGRAYLGQNGAGNLGANRAMVLNVSQTLPAACILGGEGGAFGAAVAAMQGFWFTADPDDVLVDGDIISGWRARAGRADLRPTAPNQGNGQFDLNAGGFVLRTGLHCGYTLPSAVPKANRFTAAIIYDAQDDDIRTLLALNTGVDGDMIFLTHSDGQITAKNRAGNLAVQLPLPPLLGRNAGWRMAIMAYTGRSLHLWAGEAQAHAMGVAQAMHAPADLFVGCRSHRAGLAKTLGAGLIRDVVLWPHDALLGDAAPPADLAALHRYFRWSVA